jgi:hypothetical protein
MRDARRRRNTTTYHILRAQLGIALFDGVDPLGEFCVSMMMIKKRGKHPAAQTIEGVLELKGLRDKFCLHISLALLPR